MAEIINLRRARKRQTRADADMAAAAARARYGRTKAEQEADTRDRLARDRQLDNALLDSSARDGERRE